MLEKEALAIIFGVKKFHQFLYGHLSTIKTDPKPLEGLLSEKKGILHQIIILYTEYTKYLNITSWPGRGVKADNELLKEFTFSCRKKETATVHTLLKVYGVV